MDLLTDVKEKEDKEVKLLMQVELFFTVLAGMRSILGCWGIHSENGMLMREGMFSGMDLMGMWQ